MKLALYKWVNAPAGWSSPVVLDAEREHEEYVRVSEIIDVDFPPRDEGEAVQDEVVQLDRAIEEIKKEALIKVEAIQQRKAELLALTHEVSK